MGGVRQEVLCVSFGVDGIDMHETTARRSASIDLKAITCTLYYMVIGLRQVTASLMAASGKQRQKEGAPMDVHKRVVGSDVFKFVGHDLRDLMHEVVSILIQTRPH